jgi:hypothetical protein
MTVVSEPWNGLFLVEGARMMILLSYCCERVFGRVTERGEEVDDYGGEEKQR